MIKKDYLKEHLKSVPPFRALLRSVECRLFEKAGKLIPPVLDLGCGDGHFTSIAFEEKLYAGIDPAGDMVREASSRNVYRYLSVASATELPFRSDFFNTIIANCVIEHIPDLDSVLRETSRTLKQGGRFLFGVPGHLFADLLLGPTVLRGIGLKKLAKAYGTWFNRHSFHYHTYSPDTWIAYLNKYGFSVKGWEYYITPSGHKVFDLCHYLSVPHLISRKLTGKWVTFPLDLLNGVFEEWLRPYYEASAPAEGPYIFFYTIKD